MMPLTSKGEFYGLLHYLLLPLVYFDNEVFIITAVGSKAAENLRELGHLTVKFSGSDEAENPGDIAVTKARSALAVKNLKKFIIKDDF